MFSRLRSTTAGLVIALAVAGTTLAQVELTFTFWGGTFERDAVNQTLETFNSLHPNIHVTGQHIPNAGYNEKISTMAAGGTLPDAGYMDSSMALRWATDGLIKDLTTQFANDPMAADRLENMWYRWDNGTKTIGTAAAVESMILYYNRDLFDAAGIDYPPEFASDAWTWDEFVDIAKQLTVDRQGNNAASPDFDPDNIDVFGIAFPTWWAGWLPFVYSNGGQLASDDGTELLINRPEAVEALQALQDLIYVHHVAPTPAQSQSLPAADIMMQSGKVAMSVDGHWKTLAMSQLGFNWSFGVLPMHQRPATLIWGGVTVIFEGTEHPDEAFELINFLSDPTQSALFTRGLWMPLQRIYYTDEAKAAEWLDAIPGVYPPESRGVLLDYTLNHTPRQPPVFWLKNLDQIWTDAVNPAMSLLWTGEASAQEAMDQAVRDSEGLMQGRW